MSTELESLQNDIATIMGRIPKPPKVMITGGMPYANGMLHLGHLAGAFVPPDIYARFNRMYIGAENVLYVCGTDDHGSTSELSASKAGKPVQEFIAGIHSQQKETLNKYAISVDVYTGTSREENYETHKEYCQDFLRTLHKNKMLETKTSEQWFDPKLNIFLPDRLVSGTCPSCDYENAYSEECDSCGATYEAKELKNPVSAVSGESPVLKPTQHWWLNMWNNVDQLNSWVNSKSRDWRKVVLSEVQAQIAPCIEFSNKEEENFKAQKENLPKHKSRYAPGRKIVAQFNTLADLETAKSQLESAGIEVEYHNSWALRSITRDVNWGIPVPSEIDAAMNGKTFYVWPESLIAPISFSKLALKQKGRNPEEYKEFWTNPEAKIAQFIGVDNIFFYVVMQGSMWLGTQADSTRMPIKGELQLTDVYPVYHLLVNDKKMSKSTGNFYTGDQLVSELNYTSDQVRYFLSILSIHKKQSNFDFEMFKERNKFLAGPMNAAFEKPISAALSKFNGVVPDGKLIGKTAAETKKIIQVYMNSMVKAQYSDLLYLIENYARLINKIFVNHKPHDDRHDEQERIDGLYSCFFILKNLMIMLYPFVPTTVEKLRQSLNLDESVFDINELGKPIAAGHKVGELQEFFPQIED